MDKTTTSNNGSDGATGRALDSGSGDPGSSPPSAKNCKNSFLIEKTLGNVSPCFELAFSLSFKELGSRNLKAKL